MAGFEVIPEDARTRTKHSANSANGKRTIDDSLRAGDYFSEFASGGVVQKQDTLLLSPFRD
jgi:hypothetical protein